VGAGAFTLTVRDPGLQDVGVLTCYWLLLAGSWNILAGFTGQMSFAHVALAAVGAYLTVLVERALHVPAGLAIPLAGFMTALVGLGLGLVSLRVRGIYLSLITFGFAGAFVVWATAAVSLTHGYEGRVSEILFSGIDSAPFLWVGLALVVGYFASQSLLLDSRLGLEAMAVREREEVAEGLGVRTGYVKIAIFTFSSFWAGAAGSFYAGYVGIVAPSMGELFWMGLVVAMVVIGGMGRRLGPIAGVILIRFLDYWVRSVGSQYETLIFAGLLLAFMLFVPNGLVSLADAVVGRMRRPRLRWNTEPEASVLGQPETNPRGDRQGGPAASEPHLEQGSVRVFFRRARRTQQLEDKTGAPGTDVPDVEG
jgi:branched-chain amino acid transport system permease protein